MAMLATPEFTSTSGTFSITTSKTGFKTCWVEPDSFKEAMYSPNVYYRWASMLDEMRSLKELGTYPLVELSPSEMKAIKPLPVRWVFRIKTNRQNEVNKLTSRLVARATSKCMG